MPSARTIELVARIPNSRRNAKNWWWAPKSMMLKKKMSQVMPIEKSELPVTETKKNIIFIGKPFWNQKNQQEIRKVDDVKFSDVSPRAFG